MRNLTAVTIMLAFINYAVLVENITLLIIIMIGLISFYLVILVSNYENKSNNYLNFLLIIVCLVLTCMSVKHISYNVFSNSYLYN